jgi:hypothetical protein
MADVAEVPGGPVPETIEMPESADIQMGGANNELDELYEEAIQPDEEAWINLRDAITKSRISSEEARRLLTRIANTLAGGEERVSVNKPDQTVLVKFIREGGADGEVGGFKMDVNSRGPYGETPLMQAAVNGRAAHVEALLKEGADPNMQNDAGETALMWAAAYNEVPTIGVLLKNKADAALKDDIGWTALMIAAWAGHTGAVQALLPKSNKSDTNKEGQTAKDLPAVDGSPAKAQGTQMDVINILGQGFFTRFTRRNKRGGDKTRGRKKTKSKKRGTR